MPEIFGEGIRSMFGKKKSAQFNPNLRIYFVIAGIFLAYVVILGRLYYLQVVLGEHYRVWAQGLQTYQRQSRGSVERGEIFFAGGEPLAINKEFDYVYASPIKIANKHEAAQKIAGILGMDAASLEERISGDNLYVAVKDKLTDDEVSKIKEAGIPGIYLEKIMRYYPQANVASQLVGFVDNDSIGRYGLEEYYDEELSKGKSLVLNIDYNTQYFAEQKLQAALNDYKAVSAEAIVADPQTGNILAMAKEPNFDPNNYKDFARDHIDIFTNDSCQTLFEPGSIFKAITMSGALNDGKVTPETSYYDSGSLTVGPDTIWNYAYRSYGQQTMTNVLEHSINTGAVYAENKLGDKQFAAYVENFGIMEKTGIDLPETYSSNSEFKNGRPINFVTASYGQGLWMTSIQLIRAYSALANGGILIQPSVVKEGRKLVDESKKRRVITNETSIAISKMLASVVNNGFGKKAKITGYTIMGKTGTAQMSWSTLGVDRRGYSDKTTQSFIGYFPAPNPRFLILVKLKAPETSTAEYSAMPVFSELAKHVIYVSQLPPNETAAPVAPAIAPVTSQPAATVPASGNTPAVAR